MRETFDPQYPKRMTREENNNALVLLKETYMAALRSETEQMAKKSVRMCTNNMQESTVS